MTAYEYVQTIGRARTTRRIWQTAETAREDVRISDREWHAIIAAAQIKERSILRGLRVRLAALIDAADRVYRLPEYTPAEAMQITANALYSMAGR